MRLFVYLRLKFFEFQAAITKEWGHELFYLKIHHAIMPDSPIFALLFLYSIFEVKIAVPFWFIFSGLVVAGFLSILDTFMNFNYLQIFLIAVTAEETRLFRKTHGRIISPNQETYIDRSIHVEGELFDMPETNCHVWLAVEVRFQDIDRLWPKRQVIPQKDGKWSLDIREDGTPPKEGFSLALIQATNTGHRLIENWRRYTEMTGSHPGLMWNDFIYKNQAELEVLARVKGLKLK